MLAFIPILIFLSATSSVTQPLTREEAVELAKQALIEDLAVSVSEIQVGRVSAVRWPDTSLGCPQKGMFYAQVITPGYRVQLTDDKRSYQMHVGGGRAVVCEGGSRSIKAPPAGKAAAMARMVKLARQDLARRLSVPMEETKARSVKAEKWPDAGLGCPEPGASYDPGEIPGFLIKLEYQSKTYEYHTDMETVRLCRRP